MPAWESKGEILMRQIHVATLAIRYRLHGQHVVGLRYDGGYNPDNETFACN